MSERKLEPRQCVLTWSVRDNGLDPTDLIEILESVSRYVHDSLPGSAIASMVLDGSDLQITLRETL